MPDADPADATDLDDRGDRADAGEHIVAAEAPTSGPTSAVLRRGFPGPGGPPRRRRPPVVASAAYALVALPVVATLVGALRQPWLATSDNALIQLAASDVASHLPMTGVYSRFGFHHPGPLEFLVVAGPYRLIGPKGLLVAAALVNLAALAAIVATLWRRGGTVLTLGGAALLLVLERGLVSTTFTASLIDPWNPWIALLPFAVVVLSAWSVWCRDWWALPVLAIATSFVVQAHIAYAATAALLAGATAAWVALDAWRRRGGAGRCPRRVVLVCAAVLAAAWILPIVEQLTNDPGNVTLIVRQLRNPSEETAGIDAALDVAARAFTVVPVWATGDEQIEPFTGRVTGAPLPMVLPVVAAFAFALVVAVRRRATDAVRFQVIVAVVAVAGTLSVARINGEPYSYLVRWFWIIAVLAWLSTGWSLWCAWRGDRSGAPAYARESGGRDRTTEPVGADGGGGSDRAAEPIGADDGGEPATPGARGTRSSRVLVASVAALSAVSIGVSVATVRAPLPDEDKLSGLLHIADPLAAAAEGKGTLLITAEGPGWKLQFNGVFAELERRGLPVVVVDEEGFRFGEHRTVSQRPADVNLVVITDRSVQDWIDRGEVPLAMWDPLTPDERRDERALYTRGVQQYVDVTEGRPISDPLTPEETDRLARYRAKGEPIGVFLRALPTKAG